jgi:hypothetical protein
VKHSKTKQNFRKSFGNIQAGKLKLDFEPDLQRGGAFSRSGWRVANRDGSRYIGMLTHATQTPFLSGYLRASPGKYRQKVWFGNRGTRNAGRSKPNVGLAMKMFSNEMKVGGRLRQIRENVGLAMLLRLVCDTAALRQGRQKLPGGTAKDSKTQHREFQKVETEMNNKGGRSPACHKTQSFESGLGAHRANGLGGKRQYFNDFSRLIVPNPAMPALDSYTSKFGRMPNLTGRMPVPP